MSSSPKILTVEIWRAVWKTVLELWTFVLLAGSGVTVAEPSARAMDPPLTVSQVVSGMVHVNKQRTEALRKYSSVRSYHLELRGLINKQADMKVKMTYQWPGKKDFTVLSRSGSAFMQDHVFKRLIKAENEASSSREHQQASITPENYDFELVGHVHDDHGGYYILNAAPRFKRKFLFNGRIWVDDQNFAIIRIEGQPATTLSWWTTKVDFVYRYKRVGEFWLPARNETVTSVRAIGRSLLTIEYQDYDLGKPLNARSDAPAKLMLGGDTQNRVLVPPSPPSD